MKVRGQGQLSSLIILYLIFLRQGLSQNLKPLIMLDWLASKPQGFLQLPIHSAGVTGIAFMPSFPMGDGVPVSCPLVPQAPTKCCFGSELLNFKAMERLASFYFINKTNLWGLGYNNM